MGIAERPFLKVPALSRYASGLAQRLRRGLRRPGPPAAGGRGIPEQDPLLQSGQRLRQAREARGLGLRQLAQETRISTAVLEALERGWRDRLPEPAYLRTMLPLLEQHLELAPGSLNGALPTISPTQIAAGRDTVRRRFTPGSIDVFTSWQGTLLYALVILGLIHLLNLQQFRLASQGLLSSRPLPPNPLSTGPVASVPDAAVIAAYPDLKPIAKAGKGQGLRRLRLEGKGRGTAPDLSLGVLRLVLTESTSVELRSVRGGETRLAPLSGTISLPVLPPFQLRLEPAPAAGSVIWRDAPLPGVASEPGVYAFPTARGAAPASRPPQPGERTPRP